MAADWLADCNEGESEGMQNCRTGQQLGQPVPGAARKRGNGCPIVCVWSLVRLSDGICMIRWIRLDEKSLFLVKKNEKEQR